MYKFRYSGFVKGATAFCLILQIGLVVYLLCQGEAYSYVWAFLTLTLGIMYPFLRSPKAMFRDEAGVILYRQLGKKVFPATEYEISECTEDWPLYEVRLWASGGYFGFWGLFYTPRLGRFYLYQTDTRSKRYMRLRHRRTGRLYLIALSVSKPST